MELVVGKGVNEKLVDPELLPVEDKETLVDEESVTKYEEETVGLEKNEGELKKLLLALKEELLVKQCVVEPVWVEEGLTDSVLQCVPDTLLQPDKVELAHWLTL